MPRILAQDTEKTPDQFPATLGPFQLISTELLPVIDWESMTFKLRRMRHRNPQLTLLKSFGKVVHGQISPPSKVTMPREAKRKMLIPQEATHFIWCYQGIDLET